MPEPATATKTARDRYERFLKERHRPAHGRREASAWAAFLLPSLAPGMRVLDLGCGPGSITLGLGEAVGHAGVAVGVDLDPGPASVPVARADIHRLPFPDSSFDAVFSCAVLQHAADPLAVLVEARRVCRPGAVIGVADGDWGGMLIAPPDPLIDRGQQILEALRPNTSPYVGRTLRGLLHDAGFADATASASGRGGGGPGAGFEGEFQAAMFDAPEVVDYVVEQELASHDEMAAVAEAWRRWGRSPGPVIARHWFEATARVPDG